MYIFFYSTMLSPIKELDESVARAISRRNSQTRKAKIQPKTKRCLQPLVMDKGDFDKHLMSNNSKSKQSKDIKSTDDKIDLKKMKMCITKDKIFEPIRQLNDVINVVSPAVEPAGGIFEKEMK